MSHNRHHISPKPGLSTPYQYGFNGMERQDELSGVGNTCDFGARMYDARLGRWFSVDRIENVFPGINGYSFAALNPVVYIDFNGDLRIDVSQLPPEQQAMEMERFEAIVKNIAAIVQDNPNLLEVLIKSTGLTEQEIMSDLTWNQGPTITLDSDYGPGMNANTNDITWTIKQVENLEKLEFGSPEMIEQVQGTAATLLHEYTHIGDKRTNGTRTGEWVRNDDHEIPDEIPTGSQNWRRSPSGHRGTDTEIFGLGVEYSWDDKKLRFHNGPIQKGDFGQGRIGYLGLDEKSIPQRDSNFRNDGKILETLRVTE